MFLKQSNQAVGVLVAEERCGGGVSNVIEKMGQVNYRRRA